MEKKPGKRIEEIDALRGIAAVLVVLHHYSRIYDAKQQLVGFHFPWGYYGVYLFFVISGFVILLTLHRCETGLDFGISRFSRIFPAYWVAAIITFLVVRVLGSPPGPSFLQLAANFTMLDRPLGFKHIDEVYWTLNVELSFYLWMLLLFKLAGINRIQNVIPFVLIFQAAMAIYVHRTDHIFSQGTKVLFLLEYAHLFCAGMLFYEAWERGFTRKIILLLFWCLMNQTLIPFRDFAWMPPTDWGNVAVIVVFAIMLFVVLGKLRWLVNPVLLFLGTISYTLYLLHNEMGKAILQASAAHGLSRWPGSIMAVSFAFFMAIVVTFVIEKPAMKWIRKQYAAWHSWHTSAGANKLAR